VAREVFKKTWSLTAIVGTPRKPNMYMVSITDPFCLFRTASRRLLTRHLYLLHALCIQCPLEALTSGKQSHKIMIMMVMIIKEISQDGLLQPISST